MADQSFLARLGARLGTLGTFASLAFAFPTAEGAYGVDAHTTALRTGFYAQAGTKVGIVAGGVDTLGVGAGYLDLAQVAQPTLVQGRVWYDNSARALTYANDILAVHLGQEQVLEVRNNTGVTIGAGAAVYVSGALGNKPTVALASNATYDQSQMIGLMSASVAHNALSYVVTSGRCHNLNTHAFDEGDVLWLGTGGTILNVRPSDPTRQIRLGYCIRSHTNFGEILVAVQVMDALDGLSDVTITGAAVNDFLSFDGSKWVNRQLFSTPNIWTAAQTFQNGGGGLPRTVISQISDNPIIDQYRWTGTGVDYFASRHGLVGGGDLLWQTAPQAAIGSHVFATMLTLTQAGSLGVGINPSAKLHLLAGANDGLRITDGTMTGVVYMTAGPVMSIGTVTNHAVTFLANNAACGVINADGTWRFGSDPGGSELARIGGSARVSGSLVVGNRAGLRVVSIEGGSSGSNGGAAVYLLQGAAIGCAFGNISAILGGAYDASTSVFTAASTPIKFHAGSTLYGQFSSGGNFGIGVVPIVKLSANLGNAGADPGTSGTTQAGGIGRFQHGNATVDIGGYSAGGGWIQSCDATNLAVQYPLSLQPNGGIVTIGASPVPGLGWLQVGYTSVVGDQAETAYFGGSNLTGNTANVLIASASGFGADAGGTLGLGGRYNSGSQVSTFAMLKGCKLDGADGAFGGYLTISTRANGGNLTERMRISSDGKVGIGITPTGSSGNLHLNNGSANGIYFAGSGTGASFYKSGSGALTLTSASGTSTLDVSDSTSVSTVRIRATSTSGSIGQSVSKPFSIVTNSVTAISVDTNQGVTTYGANYVKMTSVASSGGTTTLNTDTDTVIVTGATTHTLLLPYAATGRRLFIKNRSSGALTVNRNLIDTIDGLTTISIAAGSAKILIANETDWCVWNA